MIMFKANNRFLAWPGSGFRLRILIFSALLGLSFAAARAADPQASKPSENPAATTGTNTNAPAKTNASPHFAVRGYEIHGDTLLSTETLRSILAKYTGTNVSLTEIMSAASDLQLGYRARGYPTVSVTLPQQQITNGLVKIRVFEGRLAEIEVSKNLYFSSNNVMRALPSLKTNIILNSAVFQAELDRANANQDRQIYPEIRPGPETDTSSLFLMVKDRLPLHGKLELNDLSSPGTPDLRINSSLVYNNLWQREHSIGVQYSFSPQARKTADQWAYYDRPLIANYSAFYRMPLGEPESLAEAVASQPGNFGYDEGSRKFRLPPPSGRPELNFFASRATIDTGVEFTPLTSLFRSTARDISSQDSQQDWTINEDLGARYTKPLPEFDGIKSSFSGGLDFKTYRLTSFGTNIFAFTEHLFTQQGGNFDRVTRVPSGIPTTKRSVLYLPLTLRWDASRRDQFGSTDFGFGYSPNFSTAFFNNKTDFQNAAGSTRANGYYHVLTASLAREQAIYKEWRAVVRLDGQWASQPLISNEQFGDGGVAGVRGYREGEVFGDTGWRITAEQKTPPLSTWIEGTTPIPVSVRGTVFMDYGETYLLDPNGRKGRVPLWGTGFGFSGSVGSFLETRMLFGFPLRNTATTEAGKFLFTFAVTAQF
jgi:hemolysin activation/secretion protein